MRASQEPCIAWGRDKPATVNDEVVSPTGMIQHAHASCPGVLLLLVAGDGSIAMSVGEAPVVRECQSVTETDSVVIHSDDSDCDEIVQNEIDALLSLTAGGF